MPRKPEAHFRLPASLRDAVERVAEKQDRNVSRQYVHYIRRGLKEDGALPEYSADEGAE